MNLSTRVNLPLPKGIISVSVNSPSRGLRKSRVTNTVTQALMEYLYVTPTVATQVLFQSDTHVVLGTGTAPIVYGSASLGNEVFQSDGMSIRSIDAGLLDIDGEDWLTATLSVTTAPGDFVGTLSEVGISRAGGLLAGRVLDTPVEVFSDDQVTIDYSVAFKTSIYPLAMTNDTFSIGGSSYTVVTEHLNFYAQREVGAMDSVSVNVPFQGTDEDDGGRISINSIAVPEAHRSGEVTKTYDAVNRTLEFTGEWVVFGSWGGITQMSTAEVFQSGKPSYGGPSASVRFSFTPAVPVPANNKIIIRHTLTLSW